MAGADGLAIGAVVVLAAVAIGVTVTTNILSGTGVNIAMLNTVRDTFLPLIALVFGAVAVLAVLKGA